MPDSYYYQDNNGQIVGPLSPQALKQLANDGVVSENTLVRKGEQGAWYLASTIAGLLPARPAGSEGFSMPEKDPAERAARAFQEGRGARRQSRRKTLVPRPEVRPFLHARKLHRPALLGDFLVPHRDRVPHLIFSVACAVAQPSVCITERDAACTGRTSLRRGR